MNFCGSASRMCEKAKDSAVVTEVATALNGWVGFFVEWMERFNGRRWMKVRMIAEWSCGEGKGCRGKWENLRTSADLVGKENCQIITAHIFVQNARNFVIIRVEIIKFCKFWKSHMYVNIEMQTNLDYMILDQNSSKVGKWEVHNSKQRFSFKLIWFSGKCCWKKTLILSQKVRAR